MKVCNLCTKKHHAKGLCLGHYERLCRSGTTDPPPRPFRRMTQVTPMDSINIAWLAGLIEGEGCFTKSGGSIVLKLAMTDQDVVERLPLITGVGTVKFKARSQTEPNCKDIWRWEVNTTADTLRIALAIAPLLGTRRRAKVMELIQKLHLDQKVVDRIS